MSFEVRTEGSTRTYITVDNREIILLGTAHVSAESIREVRENIQEERPDHVCVEIDKDRLKNLEEGSRWSSTDLKQILRSGQGFMMLANLALVSFQRRQGLDSGVLPGMEMKTAVEAARELNIPFSCSDRPVKTTFQRAWRLSGLWTRIKLISTLIASVFSNETSTESEIEELKNSDIMQGMMQELTKYLPTIKTVLVDERDLFLASRIFKAPGEKILAVVGAAHVPGIVDLLRAMSDGRNSGDTSKIESAPPPSWYGKFIPWIIPALILGLLGMGIIRAGLNKGLEMSLVWILANGIPASLGALIALAHPLTIAASFFGAPITSLNPMIGVGMVAGILEYFFRPPRVLDMENLNNDVTSLRGWYRNRTTRILLVFFFSSLGSSIGTFAAIPWLTRILGT